MEDAELKDIGLGIAEDTAKMVISRLIKPFAAQYIKDSENPRINFSYN